MQDTEKNEFVPEAGVEPARPKTRDFKSHEGPIDTSKSLNYIGSSGIIQPDSGAQKGTDRGTDLLAAIRNNAGRIIEHLACHSLGRKGCWAYGGCGDGNRHPGIACEVDGARRFLYLHRLSFAFFHGIDPGDLLVRHKCDNARCFNPDHLELGTHADNMRDKKVRYWDRKWPSIAAKLGPEYGYSGLPEAPDPNKLLPLERMVFEANAKQQAWARLLKAAARYANSRAASALTVSDSFREAV